MTKGAGAEVRGDFLGLADDVEAEAHAHAGREADVREVAELIGDHLLKGRGLKEALAVEFTLVEQHLVKLAEISGAGIKSAGGERGALGVMQGRAEAGVLRFDQGAALFILRVGFGQHVHMVRTRPEGRVLHAERIEEPLLHEVRVILAAGDFDDASEEVDGVVIVGPLGAGLAHERFAGIAHAHLGERDGVDRCAGSRHGRGVDAADVREQVLHGD